MGRLLRKKTAKKKNPGTDTAENRTGESPSLPAAVLPEPQKRIQARKKTPAPGVAETWPEKARQFLREVRAEYRKVTWPTRKQTLGSTVVVIVVVMIISAFLGMVDMGLSSLIRLVLQ